MKTKSIINASQIGVETFQEQITELKQLLGHPEAFVTDESTFLDFLSVFEFKTLDDAQRELNRLLSEAKIDVAIKAEDTLLTAATMLLARSRRDN